MNPEEWKEVTIQRAGKAVRGKYYVSDGRFTVAAWTATRSLAIRRCDLAGIVNVTWVCGCVCMFASRN